MKTMLYAALALSSLGAVALAQDDTTTLDLGASPASDVKSTALDMPQTLLAARGTAEVLVMDVDAFMEHVPVRDRAAIVQSDERVTTFLQGILLNRQLTYIAEQQKLHEKEVIQREIQLAREQVLARHALKHYVASKPPGDLEPLAREAYLADKSKYVSPEIRVVQHILINNRERSDDEAKALITRIEAEARAPGADFTDLVTKYSEDRGKVQNNGIYRIDKDAEAKMDAAFVGGARTINQEGEISRPVPGMYGYHLIKLVNLRPERQLSFEESKPAMLESLRAAYNKRVEDEFVSDLRTQNPEIVTEVAQRLKNRYIQTPLAPAPADPQ